MTGSFLAILLKGASSKGPVGSFSGRKGSETGHGKAGEEQA